MLKLMILWYLVLKFNFIYLYGITANLVKIKKGIIMKWDRSSHPNNIINLVTLKTIYPIEW